MISFIKVQTDDHKKHVKDLFLEYMKYVRSHLVQELGIDFKATDVESSVEEDMKKLEKLMPPSRAIAFG